MADSDRHYNLTMGVYSLARTVLALMASVEALKIGLKGRIEPEALVEVEKHLKVANDHIEKFLTRTEKA